MQIDPERIADEELTYEEAMYLLNRQQLPEGYPIPEAPKAEEDEDDDGEPVPSRVPSLEEQNTPTIQSNGGIVDDDNEEEDYEEGWNNDQRRGELSERGLSVEGRKDDLIARLRRSDLDQLEDGDVFEPDAD